MVQNSEGRLVLHVPEEWRVSEQGPGDLSDWACVLRGPPGIILVMEHYDGQYALHYWKSDDAQRYGYESDVMAYGQAIWEQLCVHSTSPLV
jgi:hypothetical protein